jgi:hypothetical protein
MNSPVFIWHGNQALRRRGALGRTAFNGDEAPEDEL